tara:strand:- start:782 stop:919 length:138 start_codon:yes stop_codon:yes gene_type:complete
VELACQFYKLRRYREFEIAEATMKGNKRITSTDRNISYEYLESGN